MDNLSRKRRLSEGDGDFSQEQSRSVRPFLEAPTENPNGSSSSTYLASHLNSPPESPPQSEPSEDESDPEDDGMLAGFEFCSQEAIRYLLEEEKLSPDHPMVRQLQQHLKRPLLIDQSTSVQSNPPPD